MNESVDNLFDTFNIKEIEVSEYGWKARADWKPPVKSKPFKKPRLHQINGFILPALRYLYHVYRPIKIEGRKPFIDTLNPVSWKPVYGVPLGGIGSGSINRGFRGEFCRTSLIPGIYDYSTWHGTQFVVNLRRNGTTIYQQVLNVQKGPRDGWKAMSTWNWEFPAERSAYIGLFPRAWSVYDIREHSIKLFCRQSSPVIPHEYQDSCLPIGQFEWCAIDYSNNSNSTKNTPIEVTIVFIVSPGSQKYLKKTTIHDISNDSTKIGCIDNVELKSDLSCCIGAGLCDTVGIATKSQLGSINLNNYDDGVKFWNELISTGCMATKRCVMSDGSCHGNSIVLLGKLQAHVLNDDNDDKILSNYILRFNLVWHMPIIKFATGAVQYFRRYARWFDKSEDLKIGCAQLVQYGFEKFDQWQKDISDWQKPLLNRKDIPDWFKSALFNELYYIVDGGTVWLDEMERKSNIDSNFLTNQYCSESVIKSRLQHKIDYGIFGYLESHEYRMYNTYDVHHYSSWALVTLWPRLQESLQYDIADATQLHDPTLITYVHTGLRQSRSATSCVPHDMGDPEDEPWSNINAYVMYNTDEWKDLNCKFALQVFRDWQLINNKDYLEYMWPIVLEALKKSLKFDRDGDGVIENCGYADQTYDAWTACGISAYTGGLWLAAVYAVCEIGDILGKECGFMKQILEKGLRSYEEKLWTGSYFKYDESSLSVMADQLNGHWYLRASGVSHNSSNMLDNEKVKRALQAIYACNGSSSMNGKTGSYIGGLVNGSIGPGKIDIVSVQSEEFWVGVNYSVASLMLYEGLIKEGWQVIEWTYKTIWENMGLQYQTPEAYFIDGRYRALGYMRPLSIWAVNHYLDTCNQTTN